MHYNLGRFYDGQGNYKLAEKEYSIAIKSSTSAIIAINNLSRLKIKMGKYNLAISLAWSGLKKNSDPLIQAALYKNLGWASLEQNKISDAEKYLQKALSLDNQRIDAYCLLAKAQETLGKIDDARISIEFCLLANSTDSDVTIWRQELLDRILKNDKLIKESNSKNREIFVKLSTKYWASFCLSFLILKDIPLVASVPLIRVKRSQVRCDAIGRIMDRGEKRFGTKSLICEKESIEVLNGGTIDFLCYSSGKILKLSSGIVSDKCPKIETINANCNPNNVVGCFRPKGGTEESDEPTIISPYSTSTLNPRPEITWTPVKGATSYKVKVESYEFGWEKL